MTRIKQSQKIMTNQIRRSYKNDQSIISSLYNCVTWNYNHIVHIFTSENIDHVIISRQ